VFFVRKVLVALAIVLLAGVAGLLVLYLSRRPQAFGTMKDEALIANRSAESMPGADEDYFADMDYGLTHNPEAVRAALDRYLPGISAKEAVQRAVRGRNNWVVWTAGNDRLWDILSTASVGNLDLLKTISNHPSLHHSRTDRWSYYGLVNEPCYRKSDKPRADRFGLWLDERVTDPGCGPDPFENEAKYPGVAFGTRGKDIGTGPYLPAGSHFPLGSYYGYGTGVVGLRLFPNPAFDKAAQARWDPVRYYTDPKYYNDRKLVKPYRVGMSCGFCHVGPNPTHPPADPENPTWADLNSNPGAQYFWISRIFMFNQDKSSFVWQLFHTSRPGALDTSLVSSDQINNPRTMNAIYNVGARLEIGRKWGTERIEGGGVYNKQFNDFLPAGTPLTRFYDRDTETVRTPHVLKDGADSVGALGALNRVYVNIGLFSEEWLLHFVPLIGAVKPSPIKIADADRNSSYWNANKNQTPDLAAFFLATARPDYLKWAPGGERYLTDDPAVVTHGKDVFAVRCARCHSSKLPKKAFDNYFQPGCIGSNYLQCWDKYWAWTKTPEFQAQMKEMVRDPDFLEANFLSTDVRVPITLLETNACSPLATNAIRDNIWDNFSSESYKQLPSVGKVMVHDPFTDQPSWYEMPAGGRGYTRPASLVSLWSTAPYLQNNTVGRLDPAAPNDDYNPDPSVEKRMKAFEDGITKMLWPEKRDGKDQVATLSGRTLPGLIDRTTEQSYIRVSPGYLPSQLARLGSIAGPFLPAFFNMGALRIGPIPEGTPVNLISNIDVTRTDDVIALLLQTKRALKTLPEKVSNDEARKHFEPLVPAFLNVCKCPDFVLNRGHYFGTDYLPAYEGEPGLTDDDKRALIAFLKTF
jgi:hypothetical protein